MGLPKLYSPVKIMFWTLRSGVGQNLGVIFDCDETVVREAMRVLCQGGWKWQIKEVARLSKCDYLVETDQEIMNEYGSDLEWVAIGR